MKIIGIKKNSKNYIITFDTGKVATWLGETCELHYLSIGSELELEEFYSIQKESEYKSALNYAFDILARRLHSKVELSNKLKKKFWNCDSEDIIEECVRLNLLDDEYFAKCYIDELKSRGKGRYQIISSLKQKGIAQDLIDELKEDIGNVDDEKERAEEAARKKMRLLSKQPVIKQKEKLIRHLLSKGFSYETVFSVVDSVLSKE